ncbi:MAG: site-specific integrase [Parvularcula sp.]|jgi:integrase|nr:site-specific integrase [Parvularcula sp.]
MEKTLQEFREMLVVSGKMPRTVDGYERAVRMLGEFHGKDPATLTEADIRRYFVHAREVRKWKHYTIKIALTAIKFYYSHVCGWEWKIWDIAKPPKVKPEIVVLSREEIAAVIGKVRAPHMKVFLRLVASCGLRLGEALRVETSDIDAKAGRLMIRDGKGGKDRYVPVSQELVAALRAHWLTHRNPKLLFPSGGRGRSVKQRSTSRKHYSINAPGVAFRKALEAAGVNRKVSIHNLRHSYATNLLEEGINLRALAHYMGHGDLNTTMQYLHLTPSAQRSARAIIEKYSL